jgi:thioredoxin 1
MKKVIILSVVVAVLLIGAIVYSDIANKEAAAGNPYGKTNLHPATLEQLKDPLYDNQILPDQLKEQIAQEQDLYVYFYSPLCEHCQRTTPVLVPVAKELQVDVKKHNVLEFGDSWDQYKIEGTPTLIHFKAGKEVSRIEGEHNAEELKSWFQKNK